MKSVRIIVDTTLILPEVNLGTVVDLMSHCHQMPNRFNKNTTRIGYFNTTVDTPKTFTEREFVLMSDLGENNDHEASKAIAVLVSCCGWHSSTVDQNVD